jgi:hypothetical protein
MVQQTPRHGKAALVGRSRENRARRQELQARPRNQLEEHKKSRMLEPASASVECLEARNEELAEEMAEAPEATSANDAAIAMLYQRPNA